jgi:hypothetical protein
MSEAILATFADVKFIRTRSTMQLVLELPIEQADEALKALGGVPQPGTERWVGVALAPKERKGLVDSNFATPKLAAESRERRQFNSLPLKTQAGIRCSDEQFKDFLSEEWSELYSTYGAEQLVRDLCCVTSRSELDTNDLAAQKWLKLEERYQAFLTDIRYAGTARL